MTSPAALSTRTVVFTFLLLSLTAVGLRFYDLGTWSFGFDELFTTMETELLMGERSAPQLENGSADPGNLQYGKLPRLLCAAYFVHWLDYRLFGKDEFGSRVLMAVFGSLSVGVVYLLARPILGNVAGLVLAVLVLLWPEHIMQSQCNRFYSQSFFFLSIVLLLGGHVARNRSLKAAFWLGPTAVLLVFSNSLGGVIWGLLLGGLLFDLLCAERPKEWSTTVKAAGIVALWSLVLLAVAVWHIFPLAATWNRHAHWGYPPLHAMMSFVNLLGWPIFLLGLLGLLYSLLNIRKPGVGYWTFCAAGAGICVLLLSLGIVYNPLYGFLFAFPLLVVTALFVEKIYRLLAEAEFPLARSVAVAWLGVVALLNFPALASYYVDGNRPDMRSAFRYVETHWRDGDRLTGFSMGSADWYAPNCNPKIPLSTTDTAKKLEEIVAENPDGRLWVVVQNFRGGLDHDLLRWLTRHGVFEAKFGKKRFDYQENNVDVFLVSSE